MPLALSRDETADVYLRSDADKPEAERPAFLFYHLTRRERRRVDELMKRAEAVETDDECETLLDEVLRIGLAGWRNITGRDGQPIPYSPDALDDVLTAGEKLELAVVYPAAVTAVEAKKKRLSASASAPATAPSAPDAPAPDAATPPPNDNP